MGAYRARRFLGAVVVTCCSLFTACGDEAPSQPEPVQPEGPSPEKAAEASAEAPAPDVPPVPTSAEVERGETAWDKAQRAARVERALQQVESADNGQRRRGVEVLLANGFALRDVVQLAFRAARWDKDQGLLADLLADHPKEVLPVLLRRIGHSAPIHRAQVCAALGRVRRDARPAVAVLIVRALLDEFEGTRAAARVALAHVSRRGPEIVRLHERAFPLREDGAVGGLLSSALLGPYPDRHYVEALAEVLMYELRRFPGHDSFAVARLLAEIAGDKGPDEAAERIRKLLREEGLYGATVIRILTGAGREGLSIIRTHLEQGDHVDATLEALAVLGSGGADLVDVVLPYLDTARHRRRAMRCLWCMQTRNEDVQVALFEFWLKSQAQLDGLDAAADAALVFRLMRPTGGVLNLIEARFGDPDVDQTTLVGFLGWCDPKHGRRAAKAIEAWAPDLSARVVRMTRRKNLMLLLSGDQAWEALIRRTLADAPWLQTWRRQ